MRLYYFCPAHMVADIRRRGLRLGKFPLMSHDPPSLIDDIQWLTSEQDPKKQSWATMKLINYSRTDYRLTIEIPSNRYWKLKTALQYVEGMHPDNQAVVKKWDGHESWYIFEGKIPAGWIVEVEKTGRRASDRLIDTIWEEEFE